MEDRLEIVRDDLVWAAGRGLLPEHQVDELWNNLQLRYRDRPRLSSSYVAYYFGTAIVLLGMAWLLIMAWSEEWGGGVVFLIAASYFMVFAGLGQYLWFKKQLKIPGGLLVTIAIFMVPVALYGLQCMLGLWYRPPGRYYNPFFESHSQKELLNFLPMEIGLLIAAVGAMAFIPFPFLTAVMAYLLSYVCLDWAYTKFVKKADPYYNAPLWISMSLGVIYTITALSVERRQWDRANGQLVKLENHAYWLYFVGANTFFFGMISFRIGFYELGEFLKCVFSVGMIILSVLLKKRVFLFFGSLGILYYLQHLNYLFGDWILFPFIITVLGATIIALGLYRNNVTNEELTRILQEDATGANKKN
jgi:hypothetical protein